MTRWVEVVVDVPTHGQLQKSFTYKVPPYLQEEIMVGDRVLVPFGSRQVEGVVVQAHSSEPVQEEHRYREIGDRLAPPLTPELVRLARWMSHKYLCSWNQALKLMIPPGARARYIGRVQVIEEGRELLLTPDEEQILQWVKERQRPTWKELYETFADRQKLLHQLRSQGRLKVTWEVEQAVRPRMRRMVRVKDPAAARRYLEQLSSRAHRQQALLRHLLQQPERWHSVAQLAEQGLGSHSTVHLLAANGVVQVEEREEYRIPAGDARRTRPALTPEQQQVLAPLIQALGKQQFAPFLLYGVTGSGKTEVYLRCIEQCMQQGRQAIVLVPEIALTPQMVSTFRGRFGSRVAVLHSGLSQGERYDEWRRIRQGEVQVAIGARSAIFAPFENLGLIVLDEEHEGSYKQEETPRYHARDVALRRARAHGAVLILGSATPSLETYATARQGGFALLEMKERVRQRPLPTVQVVDMREEFRLGHRSMFSRLLLEKMAERQQRGEQTILLLNRRGFSTFVMCRSCGLVLHCPHCDISLTYHRVGNALRCHFCGYATQQPERCPDCGADALRYFGSGTQRVEEELSRLLPGLRLLRMDMDTTGRKGAHARILEAFGKKEADVLLGTQMIAKGLDFPEVTLVGVISADISLFLPDFRAAERTFQLLTQVSGRAGRHHKKGEVIIQTFAPEHSVIQAAATGDYAGFVWRELQFRKVAGYPPYRRLALFNFAHAEEEVAREAARRLTAWMMPRLPQEAQWLGPNPSPLSRLKDRYRMQCVVKYTDETLMRPLLKEMWERWEPEFRRASVQFSVDMDPYVMM